MEYQKVPNLLDTISDDEPRFITKKWVKVHHQSGSAEDKYKLSKQIRFKTSMLRSDLCNLVTHILLLKELLLLENKWKRFYLHKKKVFSI